MEMDQYLELFIDESREHLQLLNDNLLKLEKNPAEIELVNHIFRAAHTLKGMSATMGYSDLADLTHIMENVLDRIRNHEIDVSTQLLDVIFEAVDNLEEMVESIATGGNGNKNVNSTINKLKNLEQSNGGPSPTANQEVAATLAEPNVAKNTYDEYEWTIMNQSVEQGFHVFEMTITLREDCILKAARVYMVFEVLEKLGEIIKTSPSVNQLEEEQFDTSFILTFITKEAADDIKEMILKVSEIEQADIISIQSSQKQEKDNVIQTSDNDDDNHVKQNETESVKRKSNNRTIRVNIDRLDRLMNLFEELVIDRSRLEQLSRELKNQDLIETVENITRVSGELQSLILNLRMVPVDTVFNRFPRMVRQVSRDLNKTIDLKISGADTELDRTVIDEIGDPIVHLLRNAIDHGIENPAVRTTCGKSETGTVELKAFHSGNSVFIEISDDGAGIDKDKVIQKAISNGIISSSEGETMTDEEAYSLIMAPGFSTASQVSDISGRGVGLDVVKSTIESLGGTISIQSVAGQGSTFLIQLPLTLSIIAAMLVEVGHEKYAIPISSIVETAIIEKSDILMVHNQQVIDYRGKVVPLISLRDIFQVDAQEADDRFISIVIVHRGEKMSALIVDSFIGQQEIVLKSLGNYLTDVFAISGATILGDGQVALIVDSNMLIK